MIRRVDPPPTPEPSQSRHPAAEDAAPVPRLTARDFPGGRVQLRVESFDPHLARGRFALGAAHDAPLDDLATACGGGILDSLSGVLFLDTETTGLSGGAGTFVFLVGLASFEGGVLEVRQWLLPDPAEEAGLLDALEEEAAAARGIVSFHGRGFDLLRLEERFLLAGRPSPFGALPHLDLLIGARRVFKLRAGSVSLQQLERHVLGVTRLDDLPGAECPEAWFRYVKGDPRSMWRVLEHNLLDLLSLPALMVGLSEPLQGVGPAPDLHSAGKVLARAGLEDRALGLQRGAAGSAVDAHLAARAHDEASRLLRRAKQKAASAAEALAATMADPSLPGPWLTLAKDAEHRRKNYPLALECSRRLQQILFLRSRSVTARQDVVKRIARLERKLAKRADVRD